MIRRIEILMICAIVVVGGSCICRQTYKREVMDFDYSTSNIRAIEIYSGSSSVNTTYTINRASDQVSIRVNKFNCGKREQESIGITPIELTQILTILKKYKVQQWNNFEKSIRSDGAHGFGLIIKGKDGKTINAQGYGKFPDDYVKFEREMCNYLRGLVTTLAD